MPESIYGPIHEPPWQLTPPYEDEDPSLQREGWENGETHRNRVRARKTRVLLEALAPVELSGYERRCLGWVACWETHMVATLAALMRRAYRAGIAEHMIRCEDRNTGGPHDHPHQEYHRG